MVTITEGNVAGNDVRIFKICIIEFGLYSDDYDLNGVYVEYCNGLHTHIDIGTLYYVCVLYFND